MNAARPPCPYFSHRLRLAFSGLHPQRLHSLVQKAGDPAGAVQMIETGRVKSPPAARQAVQVPAPRRMEELRLAGIEAVLLGTKGYPPWLAAIADPPDLLFVRGELPSLAGVAVVGSRRATRYGINLARTMGAAIARRGVAVVSGLARGIDGSAHRGVVEAGGCGIAVLGSGPDRWYPVSHRILGEALLDGGGAVVTEYPPGTVPEPWRFPVRNRIITGLSRVVLVVEAAIGGGALISARLGLEQGREVVAIPGDIDRATSRGCNELIRDGALPILSASELVEFLEAEGVVAPIAEGNRDRETPEPQLDEVLEAIGDGGATVETLMERLGWPLRRLLVRIGELESVDQVVNEGGVIRPKG